MYPIHSGEPYMSNHISERQFMEMRNQSRFQRRFMPELSSVEEITISTRQNNNISMPNVLINDLDDDDIVNFIFPDDTDIERPISMLGKRSINERIVSAAVQDKHAKIQETIHETPTPLSSPSCPPLRGPLCPSSETPRY